MTEWEWVNADRSQSGSLQSEGQQDETVKEITRKHWVKNEERPDCKACRKKFALIDRNHHCRRCGEVFCADCVPYSRRLNYLAHLDPQGKLYKVCKKCFEEGKDTDIGYNVSHTQLFLQLRHYSYRHMMLTDLNANSTLMKTWRDKLDLNKECQRLKAGFKKTVTTSDVTRVLKEMSLVVKTPDWQKSSNWMQESMAERCQFCSLGFNLMRKKVSCKLCGRVMCKQCSMKELLLYVRDEDSQLGVGTDTEVHLAVIKIIGCPEQEPDVSMLLHVCKICKTFVEEQQVRKVRASLEVETKDPVSDVITRSLELNAALVKLEDKISVQLTLYQEVVESLEDGSRNSKSTNNTKVLAKAQDDLSDHLATYSVKLPAIKKLIQEADTDTRRLLLKRFQKAKSDYYLDRIHTYRTLKRKLSESAPQEMLEHIQKIVDKHAIVSAQIYIRQLTFESINLCVKYTLDKQLVPKLLTHLDEIIEAEANQCLTAQGEDLEEHSGHLREIIKTQMKEHKLVRTSRRMLQQYGSIHVAELLIRRLREILQQVSVQLEMKSINRSFPRSKLGLEIVKKRAEGLKEEDLTVTALD